MTTVMLACPDGRCGAWMRVREPVMDVLRGSER